MGIVLFGSGVVVKGDCTQPEIRITDDLDNFESIFNHPRLQEGNLVTKNIEEAFYEIEKSIKNIDTSGGTALGPGLLGALALAAQGKPGSQIILCTDGLANIGIGPLKTPNEVAQSKSFYDKVGDMAIKKGVSISVITVKGKVCQVDTLAPLVEKTGGKFRSVDLRDVKIDDIVANKLIATGVHLKAMLHEGLSFSNIHEGELYNNNSIFEKLIGPVSNTTE